MTTLVADISNLVMALRHSKIKTPSNRRHKEKFVKEVLTRDVISWILGHAQRNMCDSILVAKDARNSWRRDLHPMYKSTSKKEEDVYYPDVLDAIDLACKFFEECTAAYVITAPRCEADDIIAYWTQNTSQKSVILSSDKDFVQLVSDKVSLYSPTQKVFRETEEPQYDLFVKCIRGDASDAIRSSYPRVRETVLRKAWDDDYEFLNLMEHVLPDGSKVGDKFEFNQRLIDLTMQPDFIIEAMKKAFDEYTPAKYNILNASKWFGDNELGDALHVLKFKDMPLMKNPTK